MEIKFDIKNDLFWARIVTVLLALVAASFALYSHFQDATLVALLGAFGWGTFAASIFPVVAVGLNWKGATVWGAVTAITVSLIINFVSQLAVYNFSYGVSGQLVAFVCSMVLFIGVSLISPKPSLASDIDRVLDI